MSIKYVYPDLPRTGLCNMLFPWARAILFARDNSLSVLAPQWVKVGRIGPWLRGERDKRYYFRQFTNAGYVGGLRRQLVLRFCGSHIRRFSGMGNYFRDFMMESEYLHKALMQITSPKVLAAVDRLPGEFIGAHIRRGDFVTIGLALQPDYYVKAIRTAYRTCGKDVPVLVFSDGAENELAFLRPLKDEGINYIVMPKAPAIQDVLSLSRARVLVATNRSTFSEWGAFLGRGGGNVSIWSGADKPPSLDPELFKISFAE